ncbi:hypothetical protein TUSST3_64730 [Streptomyces sp. TUS-ST3]|jgi:hypothetical protein|uniref:DUF4255 domain-containing protein n=1 Tax=Streptomyces sp. TUS-ST3 TaxID=3025591 RepID=UPI00235B4D80|nr:DUF4255 domain-containing protein [Streptomyces sp. TUS-ST3]GLP69852.1 hypothetical protein TUSST3_64730 [Streptomyces sp. TUS-ST3]
MAGHQALAAVGRSIVALLNRRFVEEVPGPRRPTAVLVGTGDLDRVDTPGAAIQFPAVSVYCYRLSVDRETRPGWSAVAGTDGLPRLPLRMHLLVCAWDQNVEFELEWLGLAVRVLESEPVLTGPLLHPSGRWRPGDSVQVVPDELALDSMSEAFQALTAEFRLCLPYVARVVLIEGRPAGDGEPVASVVTDLVRAVTP